MGFIIVCDFLPSGEVIILTPIFPFSLRNPDYIILQWINSLLWTMSRMHARNIIVPGAGGRPIVGFKSGNVGFGNWKCWF